MAKNSLGFDQKLQLWMLFERLCPASKNGWFEISPAYNEQVPTLKDHKVVAKYVGKKWNAVIFAEVATAELGFTVLPSNVNGLLHKMGYDLRASPHTNGERDLMEVLIEDVGAILAYLTRQDPDWRSKQ